MFDLIGCLLIHHVVNFLLVNLPFASESSHPFPATGRGRAPFMLNSTIPNWPTAEWRNVTIKHGKLAGRSGVAVGFKAPLYRVIVPSPLRYQASLIRYYSFNQLDWKGKYNGM